MKLSGEQFKQALEALLDAYRTYEQLELMVRVHLNRNLHEVTSDSSNLVDTVSDLISWAERLGILEHLIEGVHLDNTAYNTLPGSQQLNALYAEFQQWSKNAAESSDEDKSPLSDDEYKLAIEKLEIGPSISLSDGELDLICQVFAEQIYEHIRIVQKFDTGFSGASVILADPSGSDGVGIAPVVVKIAPFIELDREYKAYKRHIELAAPLITASIQREPLRPNKHGISSLIYTYGAAPKKEPISLKTFYGQQATGKTIADNIENLMVVHGDNLWGELRRRSFWVETEYDRLLPVHFEVEPDDSAIDSIPEIHVERTTKSEIDRLSRSSLIVLNNFYVVKKVQAARGASDELPEFRYHLQADPPRHKSSASLRVFIRSPRDLNIRPGQPISSLQVRITTTRYDILEGKIVESCPGFDPDAKTLVGPTFEKLDEELPNPLFGLNNLLGTDKTVRWTVIHGDMNLENILVDPANGSMRLIDFAETRQGPTLFDIHRLWVQFVTKILCEEIKKTPFLGPESLGYIMHELHAVHPREESPVPALQKTYTILYRLRKIAINYLEPANDWCFYYQGLWIALMGSLRFGELEGLARQLAVIGAAKAKQLADIPICADEERPPSPGFSPYKGLLTFDVGDADQFFGREKLTKELIEHLQQHTFLAVIGASGSGKSSVVRAGLVANIIEPDIDIESPVPAVGRLWRSPIITPEQNPLSSLGEMLSANGIQIPKDDLYKALLSDPSTLSACHQTLTQPGKPWSGTSVLLVVDQFEEIFTRCKDEEERQAFINNLLTASGWTSSAEGGDPVASPNKLYIVCTIRADFYPHCLEYPQLRSALESCQKTVGPMTHDELRLAIVGPADLPQSRWFIGDTLVDTLLSETAQDRGTLPLLSHALLETWQQRSGRTLTLAGYHVAGGIQGAIAKTAETTYNQLNEKEQQLAKQIFLSLTELGEGNEDTRRRANLAELTTIHDPDRLRSVLDKLASNRLITVSEEHVEVAHEALIRQWPRLSKWLDEHRDDLHVYRRLSQAAKEWREGENNSELLFQDFRLDQAKKCRKENNFWFSRLDTEFVEASSANLEELRATTRRRTRIRNSMTTAIIIFAIPALFIAANTWMFYQKQNSNWQQTGFPSDAATHIAVAPNPSSYNAPLLCVGSADIGVGCSQDSERWNIYQTGIPTTTAALMNDRDRVYWYIAGSSWSTTIHGIDALAFDQNEQNYIYAVVKDSGLFESTNGGVHWQPITVTSKLDPTSYVDKLIVSNPSMYILRDRYIELNAEKTFDDSQRGTIHLSSDRGQRWTMLPPPGTKTYTTTGIINDFDLISDHKTGVELLIVASERTLYQGEVNNKNSQVSLTNKINYWKEIETLENGEGEFLHVNIHSSKLFAVIHNQIRNAGRVVRYRYESGHLIEESRSDEFLGRPRRMAISSTDEVAWILLQGSLFQNGKVVAIRSDGTVEDKGRRPGWPLMSLPYDLVVLTYAKGKDKIFMAHSDGVLIYTP